MRPLLLAALLLPSPALADTFVLVPGAFAGAWAWDAVAARLRDAGHAAIQVELAGEGARADGNGPHVTVADHVADIAAAIRAADPPVILVAHSYGGRPATGAWDAEGDRLAHLVWVEAPAPLDDAGLPADTQALAAVVTLYPDAASRGMLDPPPVAAGAYPRPLTPMSLAALYGAVPTTPPLPDRPGTYVTGDRSSLPGLRAVGERLRADRGWATATIPGGHDLPLDAPDALADLLLAIADATP